MMRHGKYIFGKWIYHPVVFLLIQLLLMPSVSFAGIAAEPGHSCLSPQIKIANHNFLGIFGQGCTDSVLPDKGTLPFSDVKYNSATQAVQSPKRQKDAGRFKSAKSVFDSLTPLSWQGMIMDKLHAEISSKISFEQVEDIKITFKNSSRDLLNEFLRLERSKDNYSVSVEVQQLLQEFKTNALPAGKPRTEDKKKIMRWIVKT
ncbi:hypothetical protein KKC04_03245, partial [Patescibacteria group bacterium]|nr:hypothetical protein [Patescibacteria group bacterium]